MNGLKGWWRLSLVVISMFTKHVCFYIRQYSLILNSSKIFFRACSYEVVSLLSFNESNSVPREDLATPYRMYLKVLANWIQKSDLSTEVSWKWSLRTCQPMNFLSPIPPLITHVTKSHLAVALVGPVISKTSAWRLPWSFVDQFQPLDLYCNHVKVLPSPSFCQQPPKRDCLLPVIGSQHSITQRKIVLTCMSCKLDDCMHRNILPPRWLMALHNYQVSEV